VTASRQHLRFTARNQLVAPAYVTYGCSVFSVTSLMV